jgi:hypothetical protein
MKFGCRHTTFDLCKILMSNLDSACKNYGIENSKLSFNHNEI